MVKQEEQKDNDIKKIKKTVIRIEYKYEIRHDKSYKLHTNQVCEAKCNETMDYKTTIRSCKEVYLLFSLVRLRKL